jgi:putative ABC transport system substrate-binding protein
MLPSRLRTGSAPRNSTRFAAQYPACGLPCAKANPGKLNFGSGGPPISAAGEQFKIATGVDLVTVQYPGDAPGLVDLLAGHVDVTIAVLPSAIGYITTGKLRALAVLSATRSPALPDIPVMADFVPGLEASFWFGLVAPKTTPAEITDRLNKEVNAALADPMIKARFDNLSATVVPGSPAEFGRFIAADTEKWAKVVKSAGMKSSTRVVGYLSAGSAASDALMLAALRKGLSESGYVEGRNLAIDFRFADGRYDRLPVLGEDLVRGRVDVIVAVNGSAALSAKAATSTTPIVFNADGDPVQLGLVGSLNRPAGNLSGVTSFADALASKQLGLLRDIVPKARLIAVLANPDDPFSESNNSRAAGAARSVGQQLFFFKARTEAEIDAAFAGIIQQRADALLVTASPLFRSRASQLIALAATHAVPAIYFEREFADAGGLMSYGTNLAEGYNRMGVYAAAILNGAKPADLPVVQPTKFEFVINMQTARALGVEVPPGVLAIADSVIE